MTAGQTHVEPNHTEITTRLWFVHSFSPESAGMST